jgi:hypothetical protein
MTDIQQARDILTKWRENANIGWAMSRHAPLIVGTAGNPDLLDAWDGLLGIFENEPKTAPLLWPELWVEVQRIAAAIIAADERMTS